MCHNFCDPLILIGGPPIRSVLDRTMHLCSASYVLFHIFAITRAQLLNAATQPTQAANVVNHYCGKWAGSPNPRDVPVQQQLPTSDFVKRLFIEPQLTNPPYRPFIAPEEKVQIPKLWGNSNNFQITTLRVRMLLLTILRWLPSGTAE